MSGIGVNPNMIATPNILPPYPQWSQTKTYYLGDVVNYAGQNWVAFFVANNTPQQIRVGFPPDQLPITFNSVPGKTPGFYTPNNTPPLVQNPNGGCWLNLSLATPPAPVWSPDVNYLPGDTVMNPPESPGTYWKAVSASLNSAPQLPAFQPGSLGLPIEPQKWELLNATNAPVGSPAAGVVPSPLPPVPALDSFTATVIGQTIECNWTVVTGAVYTGFTLTITGGTPVVLTDGTLLTYTFTGLTPGTYTVGITPQYFDTIGPSASVPDLEVLPAGTAPSFTAWDYTPDNVTSGGTDVNDFFFTLGTSTAVDLVRNLGQESETTLFSGISGTSASLNNINWEELLYPDTVSVVDSTTPSLASLPLSLVYLDGNITVSGLTVSLAPAGETTNVISWTTPAVPTAVSGAPAVTLPSFVYQIWGRDSGGGGGGGGSGSYTSLVIDGLIPGAQSFTDTTVYAEGRNVQYVLVARMTYSLNGALIQQSGEPRTTSGTVPP